VIKVNNALMAGGVVCRYMGMTLAHPTRTRRFVGSVAHYITGYEDNVLQPRFLPERLLHEIVPGIEEHAISFVHRVEPRSLPYGEAYVLATLASYLQPEKIFEIGTFTGASTLLMAEQAGPSCSIYTLDMPPDNKALALPGVDADPPEVNSSRIGERFHDTAYAPQITQLYGDSAQFDYSPYAGSVDFVLVDGSHSYDYVVSDTQHALGMLSPRGTIIWDDCSPRHPGVAKALNELGVSLPISRIAATRFAIYTRNS
jgi:predicted O-methyltransferase YrrM